MSVTICWRPITDDGKSFESGTSTSLDKLHRALGSEIGPRNVPALRAMAIATEDKFFDEVADIVEQVGAIKVWGSY